MKMEMKKTALLFAALLLTARSAHAQDSAATQPAAPAEAPPAAAAAAPGEALVSAGTSKPLTLKEAVQMALDNAEEIQIVRIDYRKAIQNARDQMGIFDPLLGISYLYTNTKTISPSAFNPNPIIATTDHNLTVDVSGLIPTGATYDISLANDRLRNPSPMNSYNPVYNTKLTGTLKQPLLKNLGPGVTLTQLRISRALENARKADLLQKTQQMAFNVIQAYWGLFFREKDLEAKRDSLKAAEDLVRVADNRVRVKVDPPINLTQAKAGAESRRGDVIIAEEQVEIARDNLRKLLTLVAPDKDLTEPARFEPADQPSFEPFDPPYRASVTTAIEKRPEFVTARINKENAERLADTASNGRLPELNANLTGGMAGIAGKVNPSRICLSGPCPPGTPANLKPYVGGLGSAYGTMLGLDGPFFALGAEFKTPIPNQKNRAAYARAQLDAENADIMIRQLEESVFMDVRRSIRSLQTGLQRIKSTGSNVQLAEENVAAERRRYEVGLSTSWDLLEREKELTSAKANYYQALTDYNTARASYELATGNILNFVGIDVVEEGN